MTIPVNEYGHPVMALIPVDKHKRPLIQWKTYQSRLPTNDEVEQWKRQFKSKIAGWMMPTGVVSGLVALDFDGEIGVKTMEKLDLTPNVSTPGDGFHVWIESPGYAIRTGAFDGRWPNMELKGDGGYVVVIGSDIISSHSGEESKVGDYTIVNSYPTRLRDIDDELSEFILQKKEHKQEYAIARAFVEALEMTSDGRNNAGFWLATQLRDLGVEKSEALKLITQEFFNKVPSGTHEYTRKELKDSVDSAYTRKPNNKQSQSEIAIKLATELGKELWFYDAVGYITLESGENIEIKSKRMREVLTSAFFRKLGSILPRRTADEALDTLEAVAKERQSYEPKLRVAWHESACYVDTAISILRVDKDGIEEEKKSPVKFIHNSATGLLPEPNYDGSWDLLRKYVHVEENDWPLVRASVLAAFMPKGAYPIVAFTGNHGSGKSTTVSALVNVTDARTSIESTRDTLPSDKRTLAILAKHSLVLAFDNESHITHEISDALAMLSTGGQMRVRTLYENSDITAFTSKRLVFINSIGDIVTESDLLDRSIIIECPPLEDYANEHEFWPQYYEDRPQIFGAILNSVRRGISKLDSTPTPKAGRMVDFARWSIACGVEGFEEAYIRNLSRAPMIAINNSFIGSFILRIAQGSISASRKKSNETAAKVTGRLDLADWPWIGSFSMLFEMGRNDDTEWYKTLMGALNAYKRVKMNLKKIGVEIVEFEYMHQLWIAFRRRDNV